MNISPQTHSTPLNANIQILRGLAIFAVVVIHTTPAGVCQIIIRPFVNFAVATFLFLSGYLTHINYKSWSLICKKRILRVIVPYIIWSLIYGFNLLRGREYLDFLQKLLTAQTCFPFYYIFVYIQFVLLTPFLFRLIKSRYWIMGFCISPIFIIVTMYMPRILDYNFPYLVSVFFDDTCLGWLVFYYLGLIIGNKYEKNKYIDVLSGLDLYRSCLNYFDL